MYHSFSPKQLTRVERSSVRLNRARGSARDQHRGEPQGRTLSGRNTITAREKTVNDGPRGIVERVSLEFHTPMLRWVPFDYKPEWWGTGMVTTSPCSNVGSPPLSRRPPGIASGLR